MVKRILRQRGLWMIVAVGAGLCWGLAASLATTRQGINYRVSEQPVPLAVKAIDFLHRHYQYRRLAETIVKGVSSDQQRLVAIFEWTRQQIRPPPPEWPIVDDHILHIIIRGYGASDQMADVFTTLLVYADVPAFWKVVQSPQAPKALILSFARVDGRWLVCDVANGLIFKNARGEFASVEELAADPALVTLTAGTLQLHGVPYLNYFAGFQPPHVPEPLRAKLQMPGPRLTFEVSRRIDAARGRGHQ